MTTEELFEKLKDLKKTRGEIGKVEWSVGMPKNSLSRYINGHDELPKKWEFELIKYFENIDGVKFIELPKDFLTVNKIGILREDGSIDVITNIKKDGTMEWIKSPDKITDGERKLIKKASVSIQNLTLNPSDANRSIDTLPPMPTRNKGEDAFDFANRKNEWKKLYNQ